jgi:hypothetical protein
MLEITTIVEPAVNARLVVQVVLLIRAAQHVAMDISLLEPNASKVAKTGHFCLMEAVWLVLRAVLNVIQLLVYNATPVSLIIKEIALLHALQFTSITMEFAQNAIQPAPLAHQHPDA